MNLCIIIGVEELQGAVTSFLLNVSSTNEGNDPDMRMLSYPPGTSAVKIGPLVPNTRYEAGLTLLLHGGATITSEPAYATTRDGGKVFFAGVYLFCIV